MLQGADKMEKVERQQKILKLIQESSEPLSASKIGKLVNVSRQLVVGDVALLRASGQNIVATPRGYIMSKENPQDLIFKIACHHSFEKMEEELNIIIDEGGEVLNVIVEHPIYGELIGNLHLQSRRDIKNFINKINKSKASMLSALSNGIHLHTIKCKDEEMFQAILNQLNEKHILYQKQD